LATTGSARNSISTHSMVIKEKEDVSAKDGQGID
jgi:hypothetical protein